MNWRYLLVAVALLVAVDGARHRVTQRPFQEPSNGATSDKKGSSSYCDGLKDVLKVIQEGRQSSNTDSGSNASTPKQLLDLPDTEESEDVPKPNPGGLLDLPTRDTPSLDDRYNEPLPPGNDCFERGPRDVEEALDPRFQEGDAPDLLDSLYERMREFYGIGNSFQSPSRGDSFHSSTMGGDDRIQPSEIPLIGSTTSGVIEV